MSPLRELETDLERGLGGDAECLGRGLEDFRAYLLLVANRELTPEMRAKVGASDLVQETFLGAHRDLATFRGGTVEEWRLWLRGILVHLLANHRRRFRATRKRRLDREQTVGPAIVSDRADLGPTASAELLARETETAVAAAIGRLAEDQRDLVHWHHRDGLTFPEIGHRLGISPDAARKRWERALKALRRELRSQHVDC
jgi:RNA polymerase sigma-70 factor (ECF subfamily)